MRTERADAVLITYQTRERGQAAKIIIIMIDLHTFLGKRRNSFMGEEIRKHDEQAAEKLFRQGLVLCGLAGEDLPDLKKGDDRKKVIAWSIRKKTCVRVEWLAQRLEMDVTSNFSRYIRAVDESKEGLLMGIEE